ncbi:MAG: ion channel [Pseudonocardia sp.]|nr:ion channel [Pseudonocardia sp.]
MSELPSEPARRPFRRSFRKRRRYVDLPVGARRRLMSVSVLRSAAAVALLLGVYYTAPLDRQLDGGTWLRFGFGLVLFAGVVVWQVRSIGRSEFPRVRAIQAISTGLTLLMVLYAGTYCVISFNQPDGFSEALSRTDALYFTVTVFATVGFGDIVPRTELARVVTMTQMLVGLLALGLVAKVLWGAVETAVRRRDAEDPDEPTLSPGATPERR